MIAKECELPLFRFDIGTVYDKWVGEWGDDFAPHSIEGFLRYSQLASLKGSHCIGILKQGISFIFFIGEHFPYAASYHFALPFQFATHSVSSSLSILR